MPRPRRTTKHPIGSFIIGIIVFLVLFGHHSYNNPRRIRHGYYRPHTTRIYQSHNNNQQNNSIDRTGQDTSAYSVRILSSKPWPYFHGKRRFETAALDRFGRAKGSHLQVKESQTAPVHARPQYITVNPAGWHNYKYHIRKPNGQMYTGWLMNRGHLVGWQFCCKNSYKPNLVSETAYLNQGGLTGMNASNDKAMLFYEQRLRKWLIMHPTCSLDYSVIPIYRTDELVPRAVRLTFVGYNTHGLRMRIKMPTRRLKVVNNVSSVLLMNTTPNAKINYANGTAKINK